MIPPEAELWLAANAGEDGTVPIEVVIDEGRRRGYCICPKPVRRLMDFKGFSCAWCGQPESRLSWQFWYGQREYETLVSAIVGRHAARARDRGKADHHGQE